MLYSEEVKGFPGQKVISLRCELFGQSGHYALRLKPTAGNPAAPTTSAYIKVSLFSQVGGHETRTPERLMSSAKPPPPPHPPKKTFHILLASYFRSNGRINSSSTFMPDRFTPATREAAGFPFSSSIRRVVFRKIVSGSTDVFGLR